MTFPSTQSGRVTADRLHEVLRYEPDTGVFRWLKKTGPRCAMGGAAGRRDTCGYTQITIDRHAYAAHRLAFLWMNCDWPAATVDHINGVRSDNRWPNLRDVTAQVNSQNIHTNSRWKKSGLPLGVSKNGSGWLARIRLDGQVRHLGTYSSPEDAHLAYVHMKRKVHAGCTL